MKGLIIVEKGKSCFHKLVDEARRQAKFAKTYFDVLKNTKGQGTTEYAILVGVLAVIAIIAISAFKGKLQTLWDAIRDGINGLS